MRGMLINFLGKHSVGALHHISPLRELVPDRKLSVLRRGQMPNLNGNIIVQGDNLHALKALLPRLAGQVKCIYIDPPYNTGNEGWRYNDRVNDVRVREWMGKVVDREDMTRHDKWCCMMYPRLILLQDLLAEDGVIFVSIDDNEQHHLRMLMDEIFGEDNFIANIVVRSNPGGRDYGGIAITHDYVLVYGNSREKELNLVDAGEGHLPFEDADGRFDIRELRNRNVRFNRENRPNLYYPIYVNPTGVDEHGLHEISLFAEKGWEAVYPLESNGVSTVWRWQMSTVRKSINKDVKAKKKRDGGFQIVEKYRKMEKRERSILDDKIYRNEAGTLKLKEIFGGASSFDYPKSVALVKQLIRMGCGGDGLVLDSFAGSGTTAQAVLELNQEDGGNRRFVLVECGDYADSVTAERVRRVMKGVPAARDEALKAGLGGDFTYWRVGAELTKVSILGGDNLPSFDDIAAYVFFHATGEVWRGMPKGGKPNFIGAVGKYELYLYYEPSLEYLKNTGLNLATVNKFSRRSTKTRLVFSPVNFVEAKDLYEHHIRYCQLPYQLYRAVGEAEAAAVAATVATAAAE